MGPLLHSPLCCRVVTPTRSDASWRHCWAKAYGQRRLRASCSSLEVSSLCGALPSVLREKFPIRACRGSGDGVVSASFFLLGGIALEPDPHRAALPLASCQSFGSYPAGLGSGHGGPTISSLDFMGWPRHALPFDHGGGTPVSSPQSRLSDALRLWSRRHTGLWLFDAPSRLSDVV